MHPTTLIRIARAAVASAAAVVASCAFAGEVGFCEGLSAAEKAAIGLTKLAPSQAGALDRLVAHDLSLARQGDVTGFSSAFLARHSGREIMDAGISALSPQQHLALDQAVSREIAAGPPPAQYFSFSRFRTGSPLPREGSTPLRPEIHGELSFTVGGSSHGGSFYDTSIDVNVTDPKGRFTVEAGFEEFRGRGLIGSCGPYGSYEPAFRGVFYPGW